MITGEISIGKLKESIAKERKIVNEITSLFNHIKRADSPEERKMISSQITSLKVSLGKEGQTVLNAAGKISLFKQLNKNVPAKVPASPIHNFNKSPKTPVGSPSPTHNVQTGYPIIPVGNPSMKEGKDKMKLGSLEKIALKRFKKKKEEKPKVKKQRKVNKYVQISSRFFYNFSNSLIKKGKFREMRRDLVKANLGFVPANYISMMFFTTLLSIFFAFFVMLFFLFFNFTMQVPFIVPAAESLAIRFLKVFWIMILIPVAVTGFTYFYPSLEKKSLESKIDQEIPFATIHMSSISGSMIEPSKIFSIIISTKEYPFLEKEFTKLQNEINIYGYDLVTALRNRAFNSPSRKLSELFNGLATTITSGGKLSDFFEKRSEGLLFEHRLNKEKESKAAETFMDIYISVVIAAPMILMLLLMMMRISGLGISLSTTAITLIMILGVSLINVLFITFLHLKQPPT
ncbi:MAG TPA: hypothetical protein ENH99_01840 [Candidatus Pacearchaeota archaeon]|nr:hypothetical protein [Candidatus Pacearchaeota archaeon]